MPFVTHFESPEGDLLPIVASELVTVQVPAAGSADLGDWCQTTGGVYYMENTFTDATAACAVLPHCTDPSAITDHGLRVEFDEQRQDWVLYIDSLPETACTLTLLFINHSTEDTPCVLPALGIGGGAGQEGSGIEINEVSSPEEIPADAKEGSMWVAPKQGGGTGENDGDTLTLAKQYTDEQITKFWTDAEVIDFTTMFDLAQSVMAGGAEVSVETELATAIHQKMQNGPVKIKVAFNGMTATLFVLAQDFGTHSQFTDFVVLNGDLLYLYIVVFGKDKNVSFRVQQIATTPYSPS